MKTLYIIDAYAQFFRAYHAIRTPMTSPVTKEPTNATYGFVGMLLKLLANHRPDYLVVATDVSGDRGTFRSELYPDYKANRSEPPDDLKPQAQRCVSILETLGIPVLGLEGYEADDVIATIARRIGEETPGVRVRIVSKDKDLQQLLTPTDDEMGGVEMFDVHTDEHIDVAKLLEDKGVTPEQVVDMLALMGDTVDNVPGVPGVGPKTAAQLISEFGSLDAVIAEATSDAPKKDWKIKGKRRENIAAAAETLPLSKQLVQLRDDLDLPFDLATASTAQFNIVALQPLLEELGFGRYQSELKSLLGGTPSDAASTVEAKPTAKSKPATRDEAEGTLFAASDSEEVSETLNAHRARDTKYETVSTKTQLKQLAKALKAADLIAVDTETTSIHAMQAELVGLSFATEPGSAWYVPVRSPDPQRHLDTETVLDALRPVLESDKYPKTGHNLKYDLLVLRRAGIRLAGIAADTMVASYLIDASRSSHSMDALALAELGHSCIPIKDLIGTGKNQKRFDEVPLDDAAEYAAEDADVSLRLYHALMPQLSGDLRELFDDVEMPLVAVLAELEFNGILCDPDELDRQRERLMVRIEELKAQLEGAAPRPFNPDSPKQLSAILFNKPDDAEPGLGIKPLKKIKTGYSTDAETLEKLALDPSIESPIPALIVEYRQLTKLVSTYLLALKEAIHPETHRIHPSFNQTVAVTGRLSSSDPNLQNIPIRTPIGREIRHAFVAPEGSVLISADYSQIELRLLAHLSRDEALIDAFHADADIHRAVAAQIHGISPEQVTDEQRSGAKMVNFGIVYGITAFGLARRLGIGNSEAAEIIEEYKARFPGITTFLDQCVDEAKSTGAVETILHRRRPIPDIGSNQPARRAFAERTAINTVVQGSAADLIKLAMINLYRELPNSHPDARLLLQIHDELVLEAPEAQAEAVSRTVRQSMETAMELSVPLKVDIGWANSWYDGK
ncbi:MAG: DNA polymerase I [bacterium]|nr:DNA polymerase I [bacterium]